MPGRSRIDDPDYPSPTSPAVTARMKANRSRDTGPELGLRRMLHRAGYRYRVNKKVSIEGHKPINVDVVFPGKKLAVFVDGCFWHGCEVHRSVPVSNEAYWRPKLARNIERDREVTACLERAGWTVVRVWEHENVSEAAGRIMSYLNAVPQLYHQRWCLT
jgi:DNA mismatch endonuclease (patch repair protein)